MKKILILTALLSVALSARATRFVVSSTAQVEDCIVRQSLLTYEDDVYWTAWNFGASQTLDIGSSIAMWNMWRGNVLLRFDLRGLDCRTVNSATFRIYTPANVTQTSPEIPIGVYRIKPENKGWREGQMESLPQSDAASWQYAADGIEWAGGQNGCGIPGIDYYPEPLGTAPSSKYEGQWLDFTIPAELVQQWLEQPEENAGLLIKVQATEEIWGDHVLIYSSEHASGKGPQLLIDGTRGKARVAADPDKKVNPRYVMPKQGEAFHRYLSENKSRYPQWTNDPVVNLQGEQRIYPYYWDIVVDGEFVLPYSYYPFSQSILGLDTMIAAEDREGLRKFQKDRMRYLHLWEYVREQRWYDCGDVIEILSPFQAACIWIGTPEVTGQTFKGVLYKFGRPDLSQEEIQLRRAEEVIECVRNLEMTEEQYAVVAPFISEQENLRCIWLNACNRAALRVKELLAQKNNGREMIDALGEFMNTHDVYLFYDSYWQMQRWRGLMDYTDPVALNRFWKDQKFNEYSPERVRKRFAECAEFWPEDRPPLTIEAKNRY